MENQLRGRVVRPTVNNGFFYVALNTGTIGRNGAAVVYELEKAATTDRRYRDVEGRSHPPQASRQTSGGIKNNFEIKSAKDVTISHNVFEYMWIAGQNRSN